MSDKDDIIRAIEAGFQSVANGTTPGSVARKTSQPTNTGGITGALGSLIGVMTGFNGNLNLAATALNAVAAGATGLIENFRQASQTGLFFSKNLVGFNGALELAQLTTDDLNRTFKQVGPSFASLGPGLEGATRRVLELGFAFQSSEVIGELRDLGYNTGQANELIAIQAASGNTALAKKKITDDMLFQKTRDLAVEFAAVTDVSGLSRKKQLEILQKQAEDESLQLAFDKLGPELKANFTKISGQLGATGMEELSKAILAQNGQLTQKQGEQLAVLGAPGQEFYRAMMEYTKVLNKAGATSAEIAAEEQKVMKANAGITDLTRTAEFQNMARMQGLYTEGGSEVGKFAATVSAANRMLRENLLVGETIREGEIRTGKDRENFQTTQQEKEIAQQKKLSEAILNAGRIIDTVEIGKAQALMQVANAAGGLLIQSPKINEFLNARGKDGSLGVFTPEFYARAGGELEKEVKKFVSNIDPKLKEVITTATVAGKQYWDTIGDYIKNSSFGKFISQSFVDLTQGQPTPRSQGSPGIADFLSGSSSFNSMFESFGSGTLATLHGMEAVVRPEQLSGIINKATAQASAALPTMANQMSQAAGQFSQVNPEVFNDIKSQLAALNSLMASHLPDISSTMTKQYSAMRDLSPDFHA